jgi:hypothetical protein
MCKPVIFDDGGSLRIREMQDNVTMDGLMDPPANPVPSNQNFLNAQGNFQSTLTVRYQDEDGVFTTVPQSGGLYGLALAAGDTITIASNKHTAVITFQGNVLNVLLTTSANASQEGPRRRYVVSNFGKIQTVTQTGGTVFDLSGIARSFTMVHFSPKAPTNKVANVVQKKEDDVGRHRR